MSGWDRFHSPIKWLGRLAQTCSSRNAGRWADKDRWRPGAWRPVPLLLLLLGAAAALSTLAQAQAPAPSFKPPPEELATQPIVPPDMREAAQQAADLFGTKQYGEAAKAYMFILEKYPRSLYAWSNLGVARFMGREYKLAASALRRAVELAPKDPVSYEILALTLYQLHDFAGAVQNAQAALNLNPGSVGSHRALALALSAQGQNAEALRNIEAAIALDPQNLELEKIRELLKGNKRLSPPPAPAD